MNIISRNFFKSIIFGLVLMSSVSPVYGFWWSNKTTYLRHGMTREEVHTIMGSPDVMSPSALDYKKSMVDVWAYNLVVRENNFHGGTKALLFLILFPVSLVLWPFFLISSEKEGISWDSKTVFIKFENGVLAKWGGIIDIIDAKR